MKAFLILEDGHVFKGTSIGSTRDVISEIVFNTSMTGYLEVMTDPSYAGQAVCMTYPLIGNYGICYDDQESSKPWVDGFIVRELSRVPSNFRSVDTIQHFLEEQDIPGISGIDTRGGEIINTRSDVNIIATINTDTKQMLLVSTPRDYFVPLSISNGVPDKLTHAGIYGIDVSMDTLGMLYDISLDKYFRVNFAGFIKIIDALGGIDIDSDAAFTASTDQEYSFTKGMNHMNGAAALAYSRERYAFQEGDRARGRHQMQVISAVIQKAMSSEMLSHYTEVLNGIEGCFDTNFSYDRMAELVRQQLEDGGSWNIVSYSVDGTGDTRQPYSMSANAYVMIPDQTTVDEAKALMQQVVDGEVIDLNK